MIVAGAVAKLEINERARTPKRNECDRTGQKPQSRRHALIVAQPDPGAERGTRTPTGRLSPADFKSAASASSAIPARDDSFYSNGKLEPARGVGRAAKRSGVWRVSAGEAACGRVETSREPVLCHVGAR